MGTKGDILLFSCDSSLHRMIQGAFPQYTVLQQKFSLTSLMMLVYKTNPSMMLVDLDEHDISVYRLINMMEVDTYIPVIAIYSKPVSESVQSEIPVEYRMHRSETVLFLGKLLKIFADFKVRYNRVKECYTFNDLINSETDKFLKRYINNDFLYKDSVENLLKSIFGASEFNINKPSIILISSKKEGGAVTEIFRCESDSICKETDPVFPDMYANSFGVNWEYENVFFKNNNEEEFSDIDSTNLFFDKATADRLGNIRNFAGYITTDTAIVGVNYQRNVSHFEASIIKELCINYNLIQNIYNQINKVNSAFIYTINALCRASEANDDDTGLHIKRVNAYSKLIAEKLGLDKKFVETISFSAQMHDVGKISVPQNILQKPGQLTKEEFKTMKNHTVYGAKIVGDSPQLKMAAEIALSHHERFDGTGYPYGKKGYEIPLSGRIVTLADIYDALRTRRVYKPAFDHRKTFEIITKGDGRVLPQHFDPEVLNVFRREHKRFNEIYEEMD